MTSSVILTKLVVASSLVALVSGHFTLQGSREQQSIGGSEQFYPIGGADPWSTRPVRDCLKLPRKNVKTLAAGPVRLPYVIDNQAAHPGPCFAALHNLDDGTITSLGNQKDCVSRYRAMDVKIPTKTCKNCVIKIVVTATHNIPIETYDSCLDITVNGSGVRLPRRHSPLQIKPTPAPNGN